MQTETSLLKVANENQKSHMLMMDGSEWFIYPYDLPTVATWIPTASILIQENGKQMFPYDITNLEEDVTVRAMKVI